MGRFCRTLVSIAHTQDFHREVKAFGGMGWGGGEVKRARSSIVHNDSNIIMEQIEAKEKEAQMRLKARKESAAERARINGHVGTIGGGQEEQSRMGRAGKLSLASVDSSLESVGSSEDIELQAASAPNTPAGGSQARGPRGDDESVPALLLRQVLETQQRQQALIDAMAKKLGV